jgi:HK97 family phage portal protein
MKIPKFLRFGRKAESRDLGGSFLFGGGNQSASGRDVTPESALKTPTVFRCVAILSEDVGSIPLHLYRRLARGKERAVDHPLYTLLRDQPNEYQTAIEFRSVMQGAALLRGNAFAYKETNGAGRLVGLYPLHPDRITPFWADSKTIRYKFRNKQGTETVLDAAEVFHLRGFGTDPLCGLSPIAYAKEAIGLAQAAEEFGARLFSNGARPGGVLVHPTTLTAEAKKNLRESWNDMFRGTENAHKVAILEGGLKWEALGMTADDAQYIGLREIQVLDICRIFGIPPNKVGYFDKGASYASSVEQRLDYVVGTLRPQLVRWEQSISRDLLLAGERRDYFAEFLVDGLLRGDSKQRNEGYAIGRNGGWFSANDIREMENLNPIEGGDIYLVPLNMTPADHVGVEPATAEPTAPDSARTFPIDSALKGYKKIFRDAIGRIVSREIVAARAAIKSDPQKFIDEWETKHAGIAEEILTTPVDAFREDRESFVGVDHFRESTARIVREFLTEYAVRSFREYGNPESREAAILAWSSTRADAETENFILYLDKSRGAA